MDIRNNVYFARPGGFFLKAAASRPASLLLLFTLFWITAAASFSGFMGKWGLRDGDKRFGIEVMLNATAHKPFAYRHLVPMLANFADRMTPEPLKKYVAARIKPEKTFARATDVINPELRFRYIVICYLSFVSLLLSLFVLRRILLDMRIGDTASIVAPMSFVLALPYVQTIGGYYYDSIELLFMSLAFLIATRGRVLLLVTLALAATSNKETFFFYLPTLYPLLRQRLSPKAALTTTILAILAAGIINVLLKTALFDSPGAVAETDHFLTNIRSYLRPWTYLQYEFTYGIISPKGTFLGTLAVVAIVVLRSWTRCPITVRQHIAIAAALNVPLFFAFCQTGELRNLSLLFVGFVILIGLAMDPVINHVTVPTGTSKM